ncbi:unnamed protein product [Penicillium pancosmium]
MVIWHIQTPIDQDLPLCRPPPGQQETPRQNDLEDPVLRNYIPANSIQGRNDAEGNLIEPFHFRFMTRVPPRPDFRRRPSQGQIEAHTEPEQIPVILEVFVIGPHCLLFENLLNTRSMMQDFMVRSDRHDARGQVIEKVIAFLMIDHPLEGIPGTGLLNNIAALEQIRIEMLPHYVPILPIKDPRNLYEELVGYLHRASLSGDLHPPRPDLPPTRSDWAEIEDEESPNDNTINEDDLFPNNLYAAIEFLDRSLDDPGTLALAQQILGRSTASRLRQLIHTVAPVI